MKITKSLNICIKPFINKNKRHDNNNNLFGAVKIKQ